MPGAQDATPSWSGYVFQGEVALCKAIEKINQLGDELEDNYCLRLEEDEDFSLTTDEFETFQVKAYTAHNYTKYKKAWNDMMTRFPNNSERNYLYLHLNPIDLSKFIGVQNEALVQTNVISGEYNLNNINERLDDAIRTYIGNPEITNDDITLKRIYCCQIISDYVKDRHNTGTVKEILFSEIIGWINDSSLAFNEKIAWFEIEKAFMKSIYEELGNFDLEDNEQKIQYDRLQKFLYKIEQMASKEIIILINDYLTPHKNLKPPLRTSIITFLDDNAVKNIIGRAIRRVNSSPDFGKLRYLLKSDNDDDEIYQLTLDNSDFDFNEEYELNKLQKHCEELYKTTSSIEVDYFVTQHLNVSKDEMKEKVNNIIEVRTGEELNIADVENNNLFGLKRINNAIDELNE